MLKQKSRFIIHYSILENHLEIRIEMEYLVLRLRYCGGLDPGSGPVAAHHHLTPPAVASEPCHRPHWAPPEAGAPNRHHLYTTLLCA